MELPCWEKPEQVEKFAARPPDKRLLELLRGFERPKDVRILDLGCAGGRNTAVLAKQGFDVYAIDTATSMVEKTRESIVPILGSAEARKRVRRGKMEDLKYFEAGLFHLVVALGVYHNASSKQPWRQSLKETARILLSGGQVLVSNFSPSSNPQGTGLRLVRKEPHLYDGFSSGPLFLLEPKELDREMACYGLLPVVPTDAVTVKTEAGHRVTVNGLYRKNSL